MERYELLYSLDGPLEIVQEDNIRKLYYRDLDEAVQMSLYLRERLGYFPVVRDLGQMVDEDGNEPDFDYTGPVYGKVVF